MQRVIGIDPGGKGAIALLLDGQLIQVEDMPILKLRRGKSDKNEIDGYTLASLIRSMGSAIGCVEQVGGITGESASSSFNFGRAAGAAEYTMKAIGLRVEMVPPVVWRKFLKVNPGKDGSRAAAMKYWPNMAHLFSKKKDDGRAEAALIALYGHHHYAQPTAKRDIFD